MTTDIKCPKCGSNEIFHISKIIGECRNMDCAIMFKKGEIKEDKQK